MDFSLNVKVLSNGDIVVNGISSKITAHPRRLPNDVAYAVKRSLETTLKTMNGLFHIYEYWPKMLTYNLSCIKHERFTLLTTPTYQTQASQFGLPDNCYKVALHGEITECMVEKGVVTQIITRIRNRYNLNQWLYFIVDINIGSRKGDKNTAVVKHIFTTENNAVSYVYGNPENGDYQ